MLPPPAAVGGFRRKNSMKDWEGKQIGKCQVLEKLGAGTCGVVYKARHVLLDKIVALKVLNPVVQASDEDLSETVERFMREARSAARLEHPNIISIHDIGEEDGHYYIVMQYIEGGSLRDLIEEQGRLDYRRVLYITKEVAKGLDAAHRKDIVHRDIKPENIMISQDGVIKITDFGVAKQLNDDSGLTQAGRTYGTPLYIAPEQAMAKENIDGRADLYSLGIVIYHALIGEPPYQAKNSLIVMQQHVTGAIPSLRDKITEIPEAMELLFRKLVAKTPDERVANAQEFIDAVDAILGATSPPSLPEILADDNNYRRQLYSELVETKHGRNDDDQATPLAMPYPDLFDTGPAQNSIPENDVYAELAATDSPYYPELFPDQPETGEAPDYPELDYAQENNWEEPCEESPSIQIQVGLAPEDFSPRRQQQFPKSLSQTQCRQGLPAKEYLTTRRKRPETPSPENTQRRQALASEVIPKGFAEVARSLKKAPPASPRPEAEPSLSQTQIRTAYRPQTPGTDTARPASPPSESAPIIDRWKTPTPALQSSLNRDSAPTASGARVPPATSRAEIQPHQQGPEWYNRLIDTPAKADASTAKSMSKSPLITKTRGWLLPTVLTVSIVLLLALGGWWALTLWIQAAQHQARLLQIQNATTKIHQLLQQKKYHAASQCLAKNSSLLSNAYLKKIRQRIAEAQEQERQQRIHDVLGNRGWFKETMPTGLKRHRQRGLYIWEKDDSIMVHVPAGLFFRGSKLPGDESPMRTVWVDAFYIDKYEVTTDQYRRFCRQTGHKLPKKLNNDSEPVTEINWDDARAYARWAGKKLPTEAEWEKSARGGGYIPDWSKEALPMAMKRNDFRRRTYPWGNQLPETVRGFLCNYRQGKEAKDGYPGVAEVGLFPGGDSPYKCSDMAGNVKEWCHDFYRRDYYENSSRRNPQGPADSDNNMIVCRGGSFTTIERFLYCTRRWHYQSWEKYNDLGVRLAITAPRK